MIFLMEFFLKFWKCIQSGGDNWRKNEEGFFHRRKDLLLALDEFALGREYMSSGRFHWKIHFKPLTNKAKPILFEKYFLNELKENNLSAKQKNRIQGIPGLTPGDFKAVYNRARYGLDRMAIDRVIDELEKEVAYKKLDGMKKIGFG